MKTINVRIGRLVLDGLSLQPRERRQLQAAIERELTRLLSDGTSAAVLATPRTLATVRGGAIDLPERANLGRMGEQIAGAVHAGLGERS